MGGFEIRCWTGVLVCALGAVAAHAQCQIRSTVLTGESGVGADDGFGFALDIRSDVVAVGSSTGELSEGRAAVFRNVGGAGGWDWVPEARLQPQDPGDRPGFGRAVEVMGELVLVGAPRPAASGVPGVVIVYEFDGMAWGEVGRLSPNAGQGYGDGFGAALRSEGDVLFVGAPFYREAGVAVGAAYIFRRGSEGEWALEALLGPPTPQTGAEFGAAGAFVEGGVLVGSPRGGRVGEGEAHAFRELGGAWAWTEEIRSYYGHFDFGRAMASEGPTVFISAFGGNYREGTVEIYALQTDWEWRRRGTLGYSASCEGQDNGAAMDARGDIVAVGAPTSTDGEVDAGVVRLYRAQTQWQFRSLGDEPCWYVDVQEDDVFSGTQTPDLHVIPDWPMGTRLIFRCRLVNGCGMVYSSDSRIDFTCVADCDFNGIVDTRDFTCFFNGWVGKDDFFDVNEDGVVDTRDVIAFLNYWNEGC